MKILHVWDQAGVACIIAKWQRRLGHEVQVIKPKRNDQYGFLEYYNETRTDFGGTEFDDFAVDQAYNYDLIHCHSVHEIATTIKTLYPNKKVFIHYHGSDLRTNPLNEYANKLVDGIFYATKDLAKYLPETAFYIPTIVDTELFSYGPIGFRDMLPLTRNMISGIPLQYKDTPDYYRRFREYNDKKVVLGETMTELSKTAYECLSLGLTVIDHNNSKLIGLPKEHWPENVVNLIDEYYQGVH